MTGSIARRAVVSAVAVLAVALVAVGFGTGTILTLREAAALDRALLAAAHVPPETWNVDHGPPDVEVWVVGADDPRIPYRLRDRALGGETLFKDRGDERLLLVPVGTEVVAAVAPRVTVLRSVGPFVVLWLGASIGVLALSGASMAGALRLALRPLDRAGRDVARVVSLGQGHRVAVDAPTEVRGLLSSVNALLDRLDGAHTLQVRFTAEAAHELRTPVTALLGQLDVALRRDRPAEELREVLLSVREDVGRLRGLVQALTALAQVDAGEVEAHRELVRAAELATAALEAEQGRLDAAGCRVTVHVDDDPELDVHRLLLELALGNLLRNAAKHAPGSEVTVTVREDGDRVVFEVRDTGPGIPEDLGDAVFDRFARGPDARVHDPGGLGLGLPLAREVARRHGGDCVHHPIPAGGTRATLSVRRPG